MSNKLALIAGLLLGCGGLLSYPASAQQPKQKVESAKGYQFGDAFEFNAALQSESNDLLCKRMFEDFDPTVNMLKIGQIYLESVAKNVDPRPTLVAYSRQAVWLPIILEEKIGGLLHEQLVSDEQIYADPESELPKKDYARLQAIDGLVQQMLASLPADSPYKFKLFVQRSNTINAAAAPGGFIYLTRGALKRPDNELAMLLGHEISHVTKRHLVKEVQVKIVDSLITAQKISTLFSTGSNGVWESIRTVVNLKNLFDAYPAKQEHEADSCAVRLISNRPGINAPAAISAFLRSGQNRSTNLTALGSHPPLKNRAQLIDSARKAYANEVYVGAGEKTGNYSPLDLAKKHMATNATAEENEGGLWSSVKSFFNKIGNTQPSENQAETKTDSY